MTPIMCVICRADPALSFVRYAAAVRSEPMRCVICGFQIDDAGGRTYPDGEAMTPVTVAIRARSAASHPAGAKRPSR